MPCNSDIYQLCRRCTQRNTSVCASSCTCGATAQLHSPACTAPAAVACHAHRQRHASTTRCANRTFVGRGHLMEHHCLQSNPGVRLLQAFPTCLLQRPLGLQAGPERTYFLSPTALGHRPPPDWQQQHCPLHRCSALPQHPCSHSAWYAIQHPTLTCL